MASRDSTLIFNLLVRGNAEAGLARVGTEAEATSRKVGAVGKALGALILIDVGYHMAKSAAEFQKATNVYVTAAGETTKNLGLVRKGILDIASSTGAPIKGLTDGMYTIEKAGIRGADGLKVLRAAAQGAAEENANLGTVTNAMTSIMASYHISADQSVSVMNQLKTAAGESKTNMEQFAGSLSTVLPVAAANHVAFADVAGALATLTQHGTTADEATQELSNTIRNLSGSNQVANKEFAQLSGSTERLSQVLSERGLTGTLSYLSDLVLHKMGPSGQILLNTFNQSKIAAADAQTEFQALGPEAQKLAQSFEDGSVGIAKYRKEARNLGGEQGALAMQFLTTYTNAHGFQDLIKQGSPAAQTYAEAIKKLTGGANGLNTTLQVTGANLAGTEERTRRIADAAKDAGKNVSGWASTQALASTQLNILKERVGVLGITIGTGLLPFLTGVAKVLSGLVGFVQNNATVFRDLAIAVAAVAIPIYAVTKAIAAYAAITRGLAALQGIWSAVSAAMSAASVQGEALRVTLAGIAASTVLGAIIVGAVALASAFGGASKMMRQVKDDAKGLGQALLTAGGDAKQTEQAFSGAFTNILLSLNLGNRGESALAYLKRYNVDLGAIFRTAQAGGPDARNQMELLERSIFNDGKVSAGTRTKLQDLNTQLILTAAGGRQNADAMRAAGQKTTDAANATNDFNEALQHTHNLQGDYHGALLQFKTDLLALSESLKTNGRDLSDNTHAGLANQQAFQAISNDITDVINKYPHLNDGSAESARVMKGLTDQVYAVGRQFHLTDQQVSDLLGSFGALPPNVVIPVSAPGLTQAVQGFRDLAGIDFSKINSVNWGAIANSGLGNLGGGGHADGGFITGPGGPRDDRIMAMLSNGEFVVNAGATARNRGLLEAINGRSGGSAGHFATGGAVTGPASTVADLKISAVKPDKKVFDDLFKAPVDAQKRNQSAIDKSVKAAFVDPQANALDKSQKAASVFADAMPKDFVKRIDSHRGDVLKTQTTTFFDTANTTLDRTGLAAHVFADTMPKDFAKTVTSHTNDVAGAYKVTAADPWQRTTDGMNVLADQTGRSVPAKIVAGFNNAVGAVKAAADQLLALVQKPIDLLHGKTIQIVANTSITGVVTAATGGYIRGPGGPKDDAIPAMLSDGEFVMNAAATKKHLPLLHHLNKAHHYADGGLVTPEFSNTGAGGLKETAALDRFMSIAEKKLSTEAQKRADAAAIAFMSGVGAGGIPINWNGGPFTVGLIEALAKTLPFGNVMQVTSTTGGGHASGSYHYKGEAVDFSNGFGNTPQMLAFDRAWAAKYGGSLAELIYTAPGSEFIKDGRLVAPGYYSSVLDEHRNHVHVAISPGSIARGHVTFDAFKNSGGGLLAGNAKQIAQELLNQRGWGNQFAALDNIISRESGWDATISNGGGHGYSPGRAYGIPQALPGDKMASAGPDWLTNPATQLKWMMGYIAQQYHDPNGAWNYWQGHHAYANGGMPPINRPFWVGENGPEQLKLGAGGATVLPNGRSHRMVGSSGPLMQVENQYISQDIDLQRELARAEFMRQTANGF